MIFKKIIKKGGHIFLKKSGGLFFIFFVYRWSVPCSWILMPVHGCRCCLLFMDGSFCLWMEVFLFMDETFSVYKRYEWKNSCS